MVDSMNHFHHVENVSKWGWIEDYVVYALLLKRSRVDGDPERTAMRLLPLFLLSITACTIHTGSDSEPAGQPLGDPSDNGSSDGNTAGGASTGGAGPESQPSQGDPGGSSD